MTRSVKRKFRPWLWLVVILIVVPVVVMASWAGTEYMLNQTSEASFCTGCHSMEPMGQAYLKSTHGGNNALGVQAKCTDCHLPHGNRLEHVLAKARAGLRDVWAQWTSDPEQIDWHAKRVRRHEFVYDSGCLTCHRGLAQSTDPAHPAYYAGGVSPFRGEGRFRCVTCHFSVGHQDLAAWLDR